MRAWDSASPSAVEVELHGTGLISDVDGWITERKRMRRHPRMCGRVDDTYSAWTETSDVSDETSERRWRTGGSLEAQPHRTGIFYAARQSRDTAFP